MPATSAPTVNSPAGVRPGRGQAVAGLLVAAAIVAFAWWIGGRAGWDAIGQGGLEAAQFQVALKQVEALTALGQGGGKQTIVVPASALEAFGNAFQMMLKGRSA